MIQAMGVNGIMATAVSGLQANAVRFGVAAFNVVNANSTDFKAQGVSQTSQTPAGVAANVTQTDQLVDLAQEFVSMIESEAGYKANAEVVNTASRMTGTLLDIFA